MYMKGVLVQRGRKTKKKLGKRVVVLHGMRFYYRQPKKLTEAFIEATGLNDPTTFVQVKRVLRRDYGIAILKRGEFIAETEPTDVEVPSVAAPEIEKEAEEETQAKW